MCSVINVLTGLYYRARREHRGGEGKGKDRKGKGEKRGRGEYRYVFFPTSSPEHNKIYMLPLNNRRVEYTYGTPMSVLPSFAERKR